jgi:hypothetical protein
MFSSGQAAAGVTVPGTKLAGDAAGAGAGHDPPDQAQWRQVADEHAALRRVAGGRFRAAVLRPLPGPIVVADPHRPGQPTCHR